MTLQNCSLMSPQDPVKGGAYNWLEYLMNKLNRDCFISHDTRILLYNTREYTNIPSCSGKLDFDSSRLQEGTFVYTLVKLYNKANLFAF